MAKTKGIAYWKKLAWDEFSRMIRIRDALETTEDPDWCACCTCGKWYPTFGRGCIQAGHYVGGRTNAVLFDEHCVHGQCSGCNKFKSGNPIAYRKFIENKYGIEERDRLEALEHQTKEYSIKDFKRMKLEFKKRADEMMKL